MNKSNELKEKILKEMFLLIQKKPGIRPRELNLLLRLKHSASLRNSLIKRRLIRKVKKGIAVHYYSI